MDAEFSSATRSTLVGSMIPACSMSTELHLSASKPRVATVSALTFSTTTLPSRAAFSTIREWALRAPGGRSSRRPSRHLELLGLSTAFAQRSRAHAAARTMPSSTARGSR